MKFSCGLLNEMSIEAEVELAPQMIFVQGRNRFLNAINAKRLRADKRNKGRTDCK